MVLFMIQVKEVAIIGPASFRSRHEMLSRPCSEIIYLVTLKLHCQRFEMFGLRGNVIKNR